MWRITGSEDPAPDRQIHHVSRPVVLEGPGVFRSAPLAVDTGATLETAFGISGGRFARPGGRGGGTAAADPRPVRFSIGFEKAASGSLIPLHEETLDAAPDRSRQWWAERWVDLSPVAGSTGRLVFRIGDLPGGREKNVTRAPLPVWAESVIHRRTRGERGRLILLVSADTCRADALGAYGNERAVTPNIDRFSRQCRLYRNAYAPSPWTLPSHASLLTATYPNVHRLETYTPAPLAPEIETVTEHLARRGFQTAAFVDMGFITPFRGLHRGFQVFDYRGRGIREIGNRVLSWIERRPAPDLFVLFHFYDIHYPYDESLPGLDFAGEPPPGHDPNVLNRNPPGDPQVTAYLRDRYENGVAWTDYNFGRFLAQLRRMGRFRDALVIFLSDHGEEFGEHGRLGHQLGLYEESLAVPLLIKLPGGARAGTVDGRPASLVDLMPTILGHCDLPVPPVSRGIDLLDDDSPTEGRRFVFGETVLQGHGEVLVDGEFKLLRDPAGTMNFVDLRRDPGERDGAAAPGNGEVRVAMKERLVTGHLWHRPGLQVWLGGLRPGCRLEVRVSAKGLKPGRSLGYWASLETTETEKVRDEWLAVLEADEPVCGLVLEIPGDPPDRLAVEITGADEADAVRIPLLLAGTRAWPGSPGALACPLDTDLPRRKDYERLALSAVPMGLVHYTARAAAAAVEEDGAVMDRLRELGYVE